MFKTWPTNGGGSYAKALWSVMHSGRAYDPEAEAAVVRCYLDASATDHQQVEHATLGGVVFNQSGFFHFDERWSDMLARYNISGIHMNQFTPDGELKHIVGCQRACLMVEIATLIESFKIYTVTASLNNRELQQVFAGPIEGMARAYGLCFAGVAMGNHQHATEKKYTGRIAYLLDTGTRFTNHVLHFHQLLQSVAEEDGYHVGSLTFDSDKYVNALQAADVVAWIRRRVDSGKHVPSDFEPLLYVIREQPDGNYLKATVPIAALEGLATLAHRHLQTGEPQ